MLAHAIQYAGLHCHSKRLWLRATWGLGKKWHWQLCNRIHNPEGLEALLNYGKKR